LTTLAVAKKEKMDKLEATAAPAAAQQDNVGKEDHTVR
jgi:hypothetical protein